MANTTVTEVPHGVNNFYDRRMLQAARPRLLHTSFAQVRDIPKGESNVIKFRRYALLSAATTALSEGVTPSGSQLSITNITGTVAQYGDFITLTDFLQITTLDPILTEMASVLGQQAGNTLDQLARDVMVAGTTVQYASTATTRATVTAAMLLNESEFTEAVRTLQGNNAEKITSMVNPSDGFNTQPLMPSYVAIISEKTHHDLKKESNWTKAAEYPSTQTLMPGEVGSLDEVRCVMTTNAKIFSAAGANSIDVHATMVLAANYYATTAISGSAMKNIIKPLGSGGTTDPLNQRSTTGWIATFVAIRLNETFAVRIEHAVGA